MIQSDSAATTDVEYCTPDAEACDEHQVTLIVPCHHEHLDVVPRLLASLVYEDEGGAPTCMVDRVIVAYSAGLDHAPSPQETARLAGEFQLGVQAMDYALQGSIEPSALVIYDGGSAERAKDFSALRQRLMGQVETPWAMFVDADWVLASPEAAREATRRTWGREASLYQDRLAGTTAGAMEASGGAVNSIWGIVDHEIDGEGVVRERRVQRLMVRRDVGWAWVGKANPWPVVVGQDGVYEGGEEPGVIAGLVFQRQRTRPWGSITGHRLELLIREDCGAGVDGITMTWSHHYALARELGDHVKVPAALKHCEKAFKAATGGSPELSSVGSLIAAYSSLELAVRLALRFDRSYTEELSEAMEAERGEFANRMLAAFGRAVAAGRGDAYEADRRRFGLAICAARGDWPAAAVAFWAWRAARSRTGGDQDLRWYTWPQERDALPYVHGVEALIRTGKADLAWNMTQEGAKATGDPILVRMVAIQKARAKQEGSA